MDGNNCANYQTREWATNQLGGLKDDECAIESYNREREGVGNYMLSNFKPCNDCGATSARNIAIAQPLMQVSDGVGWGANGGCRIDHDSNVRHGTKITNPNVVQQLFSRPYLTVPYMGNGCFRPDDESELRFSEQTGEKRSCNVLSGVTIDNFFTPMIPHLSDHVQHHSHLIEDTHGWIRGGEATRQNLKEVDYKRVCSTNNHLRK
ncbi:MAG: hypothetical protein CMB80_14605 [Flammeovirgaceae bacterium]|nr:hypothetical protein [Flammeovirgaceae bacterium]